MRRIHKVGVTSQNHCPLLEIALMSSVHSLVDKSRLSEKQRLDLLCAWLLEHLYEPIGWCVLTQESGLSHEELHRLFNLYFKVTPMQWIRMQREKLMGAMTNSKAMDLRSGDPATDDRVWMSRD